MIIKRWNCGLTIRLNPSIPAGYLGRSGPNTIEFKTMAAITDQTLLHELFHQYQDTHYGSYTATQLGEFETWLFVDLYFYSQNSNLTWSRDLSNSLQYEYIDWLESIENNGINSTTMAQYSYWFKKFMEVMKDSDYTKFPVGTHTQPDAIKDTFTKCNFNN